MQALTEQTDNKQLIAIDYEGTITSDFEFWCQFITLSKARGHDVVIVTGMQLSQKHTIDERVFAVCHWIVPTEGAAKRMFCAAVNIHPTIWIDNSPESITTGIDSLKPLSDLIHAIVPPVAQEDYIRADSFSPQAKERAAAINERLPQALRTPHIVLDAMIPDVLVDIQANPSARHVVVFNRIALGNALEALFKSSRIPVHLITVGTAKIDKRNKFAAFEKFEYGVLLLSRPMVHFAPRTFEENILLHATRPLATDSWIEYQHKFPNAIRGCLVAVPRLGKEDQ